MNLHYIALRISSDVLDLLKEFNIDEKYDIISWLHEKELFDELYDEVVTHEIELINKVFKKVFPEEKLIPPSVPDDPNLWLHEIHHLINEPGRDLSVLDSSKGFLEGAIDEMMNVAWEYGEPYPQDIDVSGIYADISTYWEEGDTYLSFFNKLISVVLENQYKTKIRDNAISFFKNQLKDELNRSISQDTVYALSSEIYEKMMSYILKSGVLLHHDPNREARFKKFVRLLNKYKKDYFAELKEKYGE
jgi:hypothetical protein